MANVPYTDEEIKSFCISPDDSTKVCYIYIIHSLIYMFIIIT